jgi:hypothetical protein
MPKASISAGRLSRRSEAARAIRRQLGSSLSMRFIPGGSHPARGSLREFERVRSGVILGMGHGDTAATEGTDSF